MVGEKRIPLGKYRCPHCGRDFEFPEHSYVEGMMCRDCTRLRSKADELRMTLIQQKFSIDEEDKKITEQLNAVLMKNRTGIPADDKAIMNFLIGRLIEDDARRAKILKELKKLQ